MPRQSFSITLVRSGDKDAIDDICVNYAFSRDELDQLKNLSAAAKETAYCPYSKFRVGATLLTADHLVKPDQAPAQDPYVSGANVENAAYPVGTCAERVAMGKAITAGFRSFRAIAVSTDISPPASPCGMCRQFLREFCALDMPIFMFDKNGDFIVLKLEDLLPMSFGPGQLMQTG